jgi:hypothetical protein
MSPAEISNVVRWAAGGLLVSAIGYGVAITFKAWAEVKSAPREPMLFCAKHGPIREQYTIDFMGTKNCSICFHERMKSAEAGKLV